MAEREYKLGKPLETFGNGVSRTFIFVLTQDCNLACGYCYMVGKNRNSRMTLPVAKQIVDFALSQDFSEDTVVWEFIGGEPLLEIDLMDEVCDYIQMEMYRRSHKWTGKYMFSISSNGVLYHTDKVQRFIRKHRDHLSIGITIDGTQMKHDMHRKFPDGSGSYNIVAENVKLWLSQFPEANTKVTFASDDLPYIKESVIHLWDMGIKTVPANVVFEDVWKDGDDVILEQQLKELADYAIDSGRWRTNNCGFFNEALGNAIVPEDLERNWCGSGRYMLAFDHEGKIYPCVRFMDYSLNERKAVVLGDIYNGINQDKLRPFLALTATSQSSSECLKCSVAGGCAWCQGYNYDASKSGSIYERATAICKMHKARVRANEYYFARLAAVRNERHINHRSHNLFFILDDTSVPACNYKTSSTSSPMRMSEDVYLRGLRFAAEQGWFPLLLQPTEGPLVSLPTGSPGWNVVAAERSAELGGDIVVYDNAANHPKAAPVSILIVDRENLKRLAEWVNVVLEQPGRIVVTLRGVHDFTPEDTALYESQLAQVSEKIFERAVQGRTPEISALTDRLWLTRPDDCGAGAKTFALGPNGLLYICPAFYYADPESNVGSLDEGVDPDKVAMCERSRAPICSRCEALHCKRCVFENQRYTGELNTPPQSQCIVSHLEMKQSAELQGRLEYNWPSGSLTVTHLDPLETMKG